MGLHCNGNKKLRIGDMTEEYIIIILIMLGCIGLGLFIGWYIWGTKMEYYKDLYERELVLRSLHSPEMRKKLIEIGKKYDSKNFRICE